MDATDALIADLYAAAADPAAAERVARGLSRVLGARSSVLWTLDPAQGGPVDRVLSDVPADALAVYSRDFFVHDPWLERAKGTPAPGVVLGSSLIPDAEFERTLYWNEFGRHVETFHLAGALVPLGPAAGGRVAMVAVHRARGQAAFEADEVAAFGRLLPHVARAGQLRAAVMSAAAGAGGALLEALPGAAMVVDGHGRVLFANGAAEALDAGRGGLRLRAAPERVLAAGRAEETRVLLRAVGDAAGGGAGAVVLLRLVGGPVLAVVARVPPGLMGDDPLAGCALVTLRPLRAPSGEAAARRAAALFGLTEAEAEVAAALAEGQAPGEIAAARAVQVSTVRTLLKRVQGKLDAANLREVVRVVTRLAD